MRYQHVCIESLAYELPPHVVTSDDIERRLAPVYERLGLPFGRLELMTGIRERRFFDRGVKPGQISAITANKALAASGLNRDDIGLLETITRAYLPDIANGFDRFSTGIVQEFDKPGNCSFESISAISFS